MKPFVKWVGGKRQLMNQLLELEHFKQFNNEKNTYFEPFVGGGAVFFELAPKKAVILDFNQELVTVFKAIKRYPKELIKAVLIHKKHDSKEYYEEIKSLDREKGFLMNIKTKSKMIEVSARMIYLNKTGFNGMYRVNSVGEFNIPYAFSKNPAIIDEQNILEISKYLNENNIEILDGDFTRATVNAVKGDLVYFDPPYVPLSKTESFTSYTTNGFDYLDQLRLKQTAEQLIKKGVKVVLSNSNSEIVKEIYNLDSKESLFEYKVVDARRSINSVGSKRTGKEIIIWSK